MRSSTSGPPAPTNVDTMALYTLPLREALNDSISSGRFADTKIIVFSQRDSSGAVCKPRALYASSHVLRTVPYFNDRKPLRLFSAATQPMTSFECFLGHLQNPSRKISQNPLVTPSTLRITVTTLIVILRMTRIRRHRSPPEVTPSTLSVLPPPTTSLHLHVANTRNALRKEKS